MIVSLSLSLSLSLSTNDEEGNKKSCARRRPCSDWQAPRAFFYRVVVVFKKLAIALSSLIFLILIKIYFEKSLNFFLILKFVTNSVSPLICCFAARP